MSHSALVTRDNPTCLVFLIDQSKSMAQPFGRQAEKKKSDGVADVINRFLTELSIKSTRNDGIRDYFHIGVIGFGDQIGSALAGALAGRTLVPIHEIAVKPLRIEERTRTEDDGMGGLIQKKVRFPIWVEPKADGLTPLAQALELAREWVAGFIRTYPNSFPPIVINITDGKPTKDHPRAAAKALGELSTTDGQVLLFNIHLSEKTNRPIEFPASETELPDDFAKMLFRMSSVLPSSFVTAAVAQGYPAVEGSRGFVFNGDLIAMTKFMSVGTLPAQNLNPASRS